MEELLRSKGFGELDPDELSGLPSVRSVHAEAGALLLTVTEPHLAIPGLLEYLDGANWHLSRLTTRHASLEDVFVSLTGRHLRDA